MSERAAYYFGFIDNHGHGFCNARGHQGWPPSKIASGFPWDGLVDNGLLKNGKVADQPDGRVFWTCAGPDWLAFYWWDRSGDGRPNSNSGFYVRGFSSDQRHDAFAFACAAFPAVVARQHHPLHLTRDAWPPEAKESGKP